MPWCRELADLFRFLTVVNNDDQPTEPTEAAYLFGNSRDLEEPILMSGARLIEAKKTKRLVVLQLQPGYYVGPSHRVDTYADFPAWREKLLELGVEDNQILPVLSDPAEKPGEQPPLSHTHPEAKNFVEMARAAGWKNVHVIGCPYHVPRCFTNTVTFVERRQLPLRVYAAPSINQPWFGAAELQQGLTVAPRYEGILGEWNRLNKWHEKGDLISCEEVLRYIEHRNER